MPLSATGSFAAVISGALQVIQDVRDAFGQLTNAAPAQRLAEAQGGGSVSTTPQGIPWDARVNLDWFDLTTVNPSASLFQGTVFDGRRIYWVPFGNPPGTSTSAGFASPWLAVYDTTLPFSATTSYQVVSMTVAAQSPYAQGFLGAVLDNNGYLYFCPQAGAYPYTSGVVFRYDTSKAVTDTTAYAKFDVTSLPGSPCSGYAAPCFDGRWIYLGPTQHGTYPNTLTPHGSAVRYDTTIPFTDTHSWDFIDLTSVNGHLIGFQTVISDGNYVYYAPFGDTYMARYHIGQSFTATTSWATLDWSTTIMPVSEVGPTGATQVGRYLFFDPWRRLPITNVFANTVYASVIARYDTQAPGGLTSVASWATFDLLTLSTSASAQGYQGSLSDGVYLYLIPTFNGHSVVNPPTTGPLLRYDTRKDLADSSAWVEITGTPTPSTSANLSTGGVSDGVFGYNCPYSLSGIAAGTSSYAWVYRWRLWPSEPDAPQRVGAATSFWKDSSDRMGFATNAPAEQVHAGGAANIRAGGLLLGQMGTSGKTAPAVSSATISTAASSNLAGVETTLVNYQLPASALSSTKGIRISAYGYHANTPPEAHVVKAYFGTVPIITSTVTISTGAWYVDATVIRQSANVQMGGGMIISGTHVATGATQINATETASITVRIAGNGNTAGDVTLAGFLVDFLNANNT